MAEFVFRQSEFSAFLACRREWAENYRARLVKKHRLPEKSDIGTLCHIGHEVFWTGGDPIAAIAATADAEIDGITEKYKPEYLKMVKLATVMTEGYIEWLEEEGVCVGETVTAVERTITVPFGVISGHTITVSGKIDREVLDVYGQPKLVDVKTRDSVAIQPQDAMDSQRLTYAVLRMMEDGTLYTGAAHEYWRRVLRTGTAKPPFYLRHEIHFTLPQLRRRYEHMVSQLTEMVPLAAGLKDGSIQLDDVRLGPNVTKDCGWRCRFIDACPLFDDGSGAWKWMLDENFVSAGTLETEEREDSA